MTFLASVYSVVQKVAGPLLRIDAKMQQSAVACLEYVKANAEAGNPASVIAAIDAFSKKNMMMNVGERKGEIVDEQIRTVKPQTMVEIGAFCGYSAVRFASLQREVVSGDSHYFSFEFSPEYAQIVQEIVTLAGLSNQVTVINGAFSDQHSVLQGKQVDIFFLDHEKTCYLPDAKLIVESGLLHKGSRILADNVLFPGTPDFLDYIQSHPQFKSELKEAEMTGRFTIKDAVCVAEYQG
ncbi:hypothetical protein Poli38472_007951 [Pythium oligandrum]|uniref:catechol O-methyltransferase n=1 Tax=Pythium oligandrum TaxID=41045 RepID=A0A8K1FLJ0_PYTOL|nr:hypothetical protein Poli38472_007951 [Pythium oligandrum]|eukprot:TMW65309.1 hypothetical protein Poli38472_007951 [Pythium oligandrum]